MLGSEFRFGVIKIKIDFSFRRSYIYRRDRYGDSYDIT